MIANSRNREILRGEFLSNNREIFHGYRFIFAERSILYNSRRISANFPPKPNKLADPVRIFVRRMTFRHASVFVLLKADIVSAKAAVYCFIWLG